MNRDVPAPTARNPRAARALAFAAVASTVLLANGCVPKLPGGGAREPNAQLPGDYAVPPPPPFPSLPTGADEPGSTGGAAANAAADAALIPPPEAPRPTASIVDWRSFFGDADLVALIDQAVSNNQELNIAIQDILIANNEVLARRGDILPTVGVGVYAGAEHVGEHTSQGLADQLTGLPHTIPILQAGLFASWEVDIWRRLRNLRDAAINRYLASIEGRNFMITRIVAEIATSYYELMALDRELEVVQTTIELQQNSVDIVHLQFNAAQATAVAVARFEAELQRYRAQEYGIRQRIIEEENKINFLVGRFPQPVARHSADFLDLQPPNVTAGVPADLIENRPDVRAAALELEATRFDVRAARARYYPALNISAGLGYETAKARFLFSTPESILFQVLGAITAPLINRRAITAGYFTADALQLRAVVAYERSILSGYMEVVTRMNLIQNTTQSFELRKQQVERLNLSIDLSQKLFQAARADYLEVLTARRDALEAQLQLLETKQQQLSAAVGLYQALGGGWQASAAHSSNEGDGRTP